jgi:hypothetical protein
MARGTGLPIQENDALVQPGPGVNADAMSNAQSWASIAQAGRQLEASALDYAEKERHRAKVAALAGRETDITRRAIELRDQFSRDPKGFDREWTTYRDGILSAAEPALVPHLRAHIGRVGNSTYSTILDERRTQDRATERAEMSARLEQGVEEVIGSAMAGTLDTPAGQASLVRYRAILQSAVSARIISQEVADNHLNNTTSRAGAETVIASITETYRANRLTGSGREAAEAARRDAEHMLLRTDDQSLSSLSEQQRRTYYNQAVSAINALETERRVTLQEAQVATRDYLQELGENGRPDPARVDSLVTDLQASGGYAEAARLRANMARRAALIPFGQMSLADQLAAHQNYVTGVGQPPTDFRSQAGPASVRFNNPGAQYPGDIARRWGSTETRTIGGGHSIAVFPDALSGAAAQFDLLNSRYTGRTLADAIRSWSGNNSSEQYAAQVSQATGLAPDTVLTREMLADPRIAVPLARAMARQEAGRDYPLSEAQWATAHSRFLAGPTATGEGPATGFSSAASAAEYGRQLAAEAGIEPAASAGSPDARIVSGQQAIMGHSARQAWRGMNAAIAANPDYRPNNQEREQIIQALTLSGEHEALETAAHAFRRLDLIDMAGRGTIEQQQGVQEELQAMARTGQLPVGQAAMVADMRRALESTRAGLANDPITLGVSRFPDRFQAPSPLDFTNREAMQQGLAARAQITAFVGSHFGNTNIPGLSQMDRTRLVAALSSGDPTQMSNAMQALASLSDNSLVPTLRLPDIKAALGAVTHTTDAALYVATMQGIDRMWARAPQDVHTALGADVFRELQNWQARHRYDSPEDLRERLQNRNDPQVTALRTAQEHHAGTLIASVTADRLAANLYPTWFASMTPMDPRAANAMLADYRSVFAERFAISGNQATAERQTMERLRLHWRPSGINGGRITLYAPEQVYPSINGSHQWMQNQIRRDLAALNIDTSALRPSPLPGLPEATPQGRVNSFSVIGDRDTEADIANGRPASYLVMMQRDNGEWDVVRGTGGRPLRYFWSHDESTLERRLDFSMQQQSIFGREGPTNTLSGPPRQTVARPPMTPAPLPTDTLGSVPYSRGR